jgi:hypothetical protein
MRRFAPGILLLGALAALAVLVALETRLPDEALSELAAGRVFFETRSVPREDPLSFSAGATPWIASSWLGELLAFVAFRAGGFAGVGLLAVLLLLGTCAATAQLALLRAAPRAAMPLAFLVLVGLGVTAPATTLRFGLVGFALVLLLVQRVRQEPGRGPVAGLALVLALAGHVGPGFAASSVATLVAFAGELWLGNTAAAKRLAVALVAGVVGVLLHPGGPGALALAFDPAFRSLDLTTSSGRVVEVLLLAWIGVAASRRFRARTSDLVFLLLLAHGALVLERGAPFFVIASAAPLASALEAVFPRLALRGSPSERTFPFAPLALALGLLAPLAPGFGAALVAEHEDAFALARVAASIDGRERLWNEVGSGGALEWAFAGERRVWVWEDLLSRLHMDLVMTHSGSTLDQALRARSWRVEKERPTLVLLRR